MIVIRKLFIYIPDEIRDKKFWSSICIFVIFILIVYFHIIDVCYC